MTTLPSTFTQLLIDWSNGDKTALDKLVPIVYDELRRLAQNQMKKERRDHTLQATALVHEAYERLVDYSGGGLLNRAHFFRVAAKVMRQILVDHARAHCREKRGGGFVRVSLGTADGAWEGRREEVIALHEAVTQLVEEDPHKGEIVEMRFFGGMSNEEIGKAVGISTRAVIRDLRFAEAWLRRKLTTGSGTSRSEADKDERD